MTLHELGLKYGTDKATAHNYCRFYQQEFESRNFSPRRVLEIGVKDGSSLQMWRDFFPRAEIVGIDINPPITIPGCVVRQMNQTDVFALLQLGDFDLIIDDGSHMTLDQQISFSHLYFRQLRMGGIYIMEDIHTSQYAGYVNSSRTTREVFEGWTFVTKLFQRIPGDFSDSNTLLIPKK